MTPEKIGERLEGILEAKFFLFDADAVCDGHQGNLAFITKAEEDVFFIPLVIAERISEYLDVVKEFRKASLEANDSLEQLVETQDKYINTLRNKDIQAEINRLDSLEVQLQPNIAPSINWDKYCISSKDNL